MKKRKFNLKKNTTLKRNKIPPENVFLKFINSRHHPVILLASRPAVGKTKLVFTVAVRLADISGMKSVIVSAKRDELDMKERIRSSIILNDKDEDVFVWDGKNIYCKQFAQFMREKGIGLIIIDDSYKMTQVFAMRKVRDLACEFDIPVIVLKNLSRRTERRLDHRPRIQDIRNRRQILPYVDRVVLLYRDSYYYPHADSDNAVLYVGNQKSDKYKTISIMWDDNRY